MAAMLCCLATAGFNTPALLPRAAVASATARSSHAHALAVPDAIAAIGSPELLGVVAAAAVGGILLRGGDDAGSKEAAVDTAEVQSNKIAALKADGLMTIARRADTAAAAEELLRRASLYDARRPTSAPSGAPSARSCVA